MEELRTVILSFGGIFTFAFGLAWILPLATAGRKEAKLKRDDAAFALLDLLLMAFDCIPFFWLFRAIPETPSAYRAARQAWRSQPTIRSMFWLSAAALVVTILAWNIPP
jgi:hypothetical protein